MKFSITASLVLVVFLSLSNTSAQAAPGRGGYGYGHNHGRYNNRPVVRVYVPPVVIGGCYGNRCQPRPRYYAQRSCAPRYYAQRPCAPRYNAPRYYGGGYRNCR